MKKSIFKSLTFWLIFTALIISLLVIFVSPYFIESYQDLNFRLLIAFSIFFGTMIIILLTLLFKKDETQELLKEKKEQREIKEEYQKVINKKVKYLKTQFNDAIKIIKKSSLYKNKRQANYELPWYLVVGDKSEGKTTLIESSGLDFPLNVNYNKNEVVDEHSSENFQWYFSEHSIFIDMPGKYIEQKENPEDPIVWKEFLKIFNKKRWSRPINGIILPISTDTLLEKNEKEIEQYGKDLRDRFDELSTAFMSSIPIYLIVTKSDKIEGFNEYFSSLTQDEKNEILGITFDNSNTNIDVNIVRPELENLLKRLNSSVLEKMHYEWEENHRGKVFLFCENLSKLFEKTNLFTDICFSQTRYRKPLKLRGIYFTSVPGEYNPHALVSEDDLEIARGSKGLFIKKLLNDIIFPEADIIKMDDSYKNRTKKNQVIAYTFSFLLVTFFSVFIVKDFLNHNTVLTKLEKSYQIYKDEKNKILPSDDFSTILTVIENINQIRQFDKANTSSDLWKLLFYDIEDRYNKLEQVYYEDLASLLLPRIAKRIEYNMKHELKDFDKTWNNTKAYVMLENIKRRDPEYLKNYMAINWNQLYVNTPKIENSLNYHWENLIKYGFKSFDLKKPILKLARQRLTKLGSEALTYKGLKNKFRKMNLKDFSFYQVLGSNVSSFENNDYTIPGFYSKEGYAIMLKQGLKLTNNILLDNWVLDQRTDLSTVEINEHYKKILSFYFADYKKYWLKALSILSIPRHNNIGSLNNQLSVLSSSDSPIISVLRALKYNTDIYTPAEQLAMKSDNNVTNAVVNSMTTGIIAKFIAKKAIKNVGKTMDNTSIKNLREFFKPYNELLTKEDQASNILKNAVSKLNKTYETMTSLSGAVTPKYDAFKIVSNRVQGKSEPILVPLNSLPIHVKKWYRSTLQNNWIFLVNYAKLYINIKYKEDVLSFYNERLRNKYPIYKKESNNFVKLDDFSDFFKKGGVIDRFYKSYVSNFAKIHSNYSSYNLLNIDGARMNITKGFMHSILRAYKIRRIFFRNDGTLGLVASIKPHDLGTNLATMELSYDDDTTFYEHGPRKNKKIVWPPQSMNNVIKFNLLDLTNNIVVENYLDNDWALFKMFDKFSSKPISNNSIILKYRHDDYEGSFYLKGGISTLFNKYNSLSDFHLSKSL